MTDAARTLNELATAGLCLTAAGVVAGARDLTATYIKGRTQFGRSLAEFQAVAMQIADVYITSRTLDLAVGQRGLADRARGSTSPTTSRSRRTGPATRRPARCAPATTCTAAWAST